MSYLLVNDDGGEIVAVLESLDEVANAIEEAEQQQPPLRLAVVAFHDAPGSIIGTQTSVTMRPLR